MWFMAFLYLCKVASKCASVRCVNGWMAECVDGTSNWHHPSCCWLIPCLFCFQPFTAILPQFRPFSLHSSFLAFGTAFCRFHTAACCDSIHPLSALSLCCVSFFQTILQSKQSPKSPIQSATNCLTGWAGWLAGLSARLMSSRPRPIQPIPFNRQKLRVAHNFHNPQTTTRNRKGKLSVATARNSRVNWKSWLNEDW